MAAPAVRNLFGEECAINGDMLSSTVSPQNLITDCVLQHDGISHPLERVAVNWPHSLLP